MAIQTIGGAAASTGVQGTPILKIQRATPSQAGVSSGFNDTESLMEYTLTTPLPPGNYFFSFYAASTNGGAQVILGLSDGTVLAAAQSNGSTSVVATSVPATKTLTKIWFRKNGTIDAWCPTITLDATISTDTAAFYGYSKTQATSRAFTLPSIPTGYQKVSNNNWLNASQVSRDGTKTYFVVMRSAARSLSTTGYASNFGAEHNTNLNSTLKFYEYDLVNGVLTEKAQPVFNASLNCGLGWNPSSYSTTSISHLASAYCFVATDYVYLDAGYCSLYAFDGSNSLTGEYPYGQMGRYTIATNTWTAVNSVRNNGLQGLQPNYAGITTAGNSLVWVPTFYYRNAYNTADSINLYMYNWYTQYAQNYAFMYRPSAGWTNVYNQQSTSSYSAPRSYGSTSPATDRYVFFDTYYSATPPSSNGTINILDVDGAVAVQRYISGVSAALSSDFSGSGANLSPYSFTTNAWFKHPTDGTKVYLCPSYSGVNEFFLLDMGIPSVAGGAMGSGTNSSTVLNWYMSKTKWKLYQPSQSNYGFLHIPSLNVLIYCTTSYTPNTSSTQSIKLGYEVVPYPDALSSY